MLNNLHKTLLPHWLQLQQQTAANPRLRWMLWGILYIFLIYFALSLGEWRTGQQQEISQLQRTAIKLEHLESQTEWPERWADEQQISEQLKAKLWKAATPALAEADLQNYLRSLMTRVDARDTRLRLAPTETLTMGDETLFKVSADVSGIVGSARINDLMLAMANHPQVLLIERFNYGPQRGGQLGMLVIGYFSASVAPASEVSNAAP